MNRTALAELEDFQGILAKAGYDCRIAPLGRFPRVLLAENPYALVAAVESDTWDELVELVSDIQAELTHVALDAEQMSIRWDLYVLVHVRNATLRPIESATLDRVESDTRFARKFVRVNLTRDEHTLDRALRPFLPLRPAAPLGIKEPMDLLRAELLEEGVDQKVVAHALERFKRTGEVALP